MPVGNYFKIRLVVASYQTGVDGVEPKFDLVAEPYAEIEYVSQTKSFDANKAAFKTTYNLFINYDSTYDINVRQLVEFNNRTYVIQSVDRGNKGRRTEGAFEWVTDQIKGRYWRIVATSQDIS